MAGQNPNAARDNAATGHWRQYVTSDTLQAVDLQGRNVVVVIDRVVRAQMSDRQDPKKAKGVLQVYFKGKRKPLVVKAELASVISKLAGSTACAKWVGVAIEIYPTTVYAFGQVHEVVRISPKRPTAEQAKAAGGRAPEPEPPDTDLEPDEIREGDPTPTVDQMERSLKAQGFIDETTKERRTQVERQAAEDFDRAKSRAERALGRELGGNDQLTEADKRAIELAEAAEAEEERRRRG